MTFIRRCLTLLILILPLICFAQPKDNSPYSRLGIGDISDDNFMATRHMGGIGASYVGPYNINIVNPASLAYLSTASFDVGVHAELSNISDNVNPSSNSWNGNISYLSLAFPLQNQVNDLLDRKVRNWKYGMGFTLKPFSTVGYNIEVPQFTEETGETRQSNIGFGGTYDFTWSTAVNYKNLAMGLNLGSLFGSITNRSAVNFLDLPGAVNTLIENKRNMSGFLYRVGFLYTHNFKRNESEENNKAPGNKMTFGLHVNSKSNLTIDETISIGTEQIIGSSIFRDTSSINLITPSKLPAELGFGATYYMGEKFAIGVNFTTTSWSDFISSTDNETLNDASELSFGGYYRPNYKSAGSYLARVLYRFGAYYKETPIEVENERVRDYGLTAGFGLPFFFQRKISHANLGLELGLKGDNTILEEKYMRLSFSFTFNDDEWFLKRKYN